MAAEREVKLLGFWASPFVIRAKIALGLKGAEYEYFEETLRNKSELLLKSNPVYKKVPVLIHNGKPICESMIIVQYIDDVWSGAGPSIVPSDPFDAAVVRFWSHYVDDKWFHSLSEVFEGETREAKIDAAREAIARLEPLEAAFDEKQQSKGKKHFFGGETIGFLDIALGSYLVWIKVFEKMTGLEFFDKFPNLSAWAECFWADDVVKAVTPEVDAVVDFAKKIQAMPNSPPPPTTN